MDKIIFYPFSGNNILVFVEIPDMGLFSTLQVIYTNSVTKLVFFV